MATKIERIEYYNADGSLANIEEVEVEVPDAEAEEEEVVMMGGTTRQLRAQKLEIVPDGIASQSSIVLTTETGAKMEISVTSEGTLQIVPL